MKKLKFIANIFFLLSLTLMLLDILQQLNIIHFLPTTIPPYKPSTHEAINKAVKYTILINSIGYIFLFISITLHILNLIITLKSKKTKNEISTYTNIPFDVNRSLIEKKHYTRGGFISSRTVQDNFKGNIYTAYGIYEYKFKENASMGFMVGGANTNHKITHSKRSAESTPTDSTVKGTSAYLGTYYNQEVISSKINWINGLGVQYGSYKTERHLRNNYQGFDSKGKVKVKGLNTYTGFVISYPIQEDVALQFKGILSYTFLKQGKVKENNGLAIDVDSKNYNYLDSEVGVGMSKTLYDIDGKSNLTASISGISGLYGYKNDDLKARIAGSTSSFNIKGDRVKKDAVKILIDYNVQKATGFNYGLEGTYISNSAESNVKIGVKAGYVF